MVPQGLEDTVAQALDVSKVRSKTDIAKVQDIQDLWSRFTARLQFRLNLAKMYFDFHRHRQLVSCTWKKKSWTSYFYTMMLQMAIFLLNWHSKYLIIWYLYFIQWVVGIKRLLGLGLWVNFMKNENVAKCAWFFLLVKNKIHSSLYTLL